jgi:epoxyqueuosine reductase
LPPRPALATPAARSAWLKQRAKAAGFDRAGVARLPPGGEETVAGERLRAWLRAGHAAGMTYVARTAGLRADPRQLLPGARSVLALAVRYPGAAPEPRPGEGRVARYALGRDYHNRLLRPLRKLLKAYLAAFPGADAVGFVDRGPVMEKAWAARAGLGWIGKNTLLLDAEDGSYLWLATLLVTVELEPDRPQLDACGDCRLCLDSCPTGAFPAPYVLDARLCISYHTIENRGEVPEALKPAIGDRLLGCDVCQEVCPYNQPALTRRSPASPAPFAGGAPAPAPASPPASEPPLHQELAPVLALDSAAAFRDLAGGRPLARPGRDGLVRNACIVAGNSGDRRHRPALERLLADPSPLVRESAAWALERLAAT